METVTAASNLYDAGCNRGVAHAGDVLTRARYCQMKCRLRQKCDVSECCCAHLVPLLS